jgi:uncharacterized repeat protein (TIGR03809 family)
MQALPSRPRLDQIAQKWHDLAQRRLDHYTELYRSGRWQRYYTQERFAMRMLDVINAAKKWRELAGLSQAELSQAELSQAELSQAEPSTRRDDEMRPAA